MEFRNTNTLSQRQIFGPILSGIFGGGDETTTTKKSLSTASTTLPLTSKSTQPATITKAPSVIQSSTSLPLSTGQPSSTSSLASTVSDTTSAVVTPTITPSASSTSTFESTSNGSLFTVTTEVSAPTPSTSAAAAANTSKSFLQNKALSGAVFALVGVVALVLIVTIATFALRRRKKNRLLEDAISFDPGVTGSNRYDHLSDEGSVGKPETSRGEGYGYSAQSNSGDQARYYDARSNGYPAPRSVIPPPSVYMQDYQQPQQDYLRAQPLPNPHSPMSGQYPQNYPRGQDAVPPVRPLPATFGSDDSVQYQPRGNFKIVNE